MFSFISTRKGLVIYESTDSAWKRHSIHFEGIPVSLTHYDKARNQLWAFLDHGHWGIKVHRSSDFGQHWEALPAPAYAEGVEIKTGKKASVRYIWAAQSMPLGSAFEMHIGTDPGGLFSWQEESQSWHLNESLWNRPERQNHWFGGGRDQPGIHSIVVDPQDANHMYVGISCAGVYETRDGGHSWAGKNKGLRADFFPDP